MFSSLTLLYSKGASCSDPNNITTVMCQLVKYASYKKISGVETKSLNILCFHNLCAPLIVFGGPALKRGQPVSFEYLRNNFSSKTPLYFGECLLKILCYWGVQPLRALLVLKSYTILYNYSLVRLYMHLLIVPTCITK